MAQSDPEQPAKPSPAPELPEAIIAALGAAGTDATRLAATVAELCRVHAELAPAIHRQARAQQRAELGLRMLTQWGGLLRESEALAAGTMIGVYRILVELGRGGAGVVYRAEQTAPVQRQVALKVLQQSSSQSELAQRLRLETQLLAELDHPGIAKVLDAGTLPDGQPYLVMELVLGEPITDYCDRRRWSLPARVGLLIQTAQAVQHAHQRGVLHRDLKPGNVLVTDSSGEAMPKIIDFGLAKVVGKPSAEVGRTEFGQLVGTPEYMSPEQAAGQAIDTRTDVYALGVILHELVSGSLPFDPIRLRSGGLAALVQILAVESPRTPSESLADPSLCAAAAEKRQTTALELRRAVRGELAWILRGCLEKDKERRYAGVPELLTDLRAYLANGPLSVGPTRVSYRLRHWVHRHRAAATVLLTVLIAAVITLVATLWSLLRVRDAHRQSQVAAYAVSIAAAQSALRNGVAGTARGYLEQAPENLRRFEWHWLMRSMRGSHQWSANLSLPRPMVLAASAQFVLVGDQDTGQESLHRLATGEQVDLRRVEAPPLSAVATGQGEQLCVGRRGGAIEVVDLPSWQTTLRIATGAPNVHSVAVVGQVVFGACETAIVAYDLKTGATQGSWTCPGERIFRVAVSSDGQWIAGAAHGRRAVVVWQRNWAEPVWSRPLEHFQETLAWHPTLPLLASGGQGGVLRLWRREDGELLGMRDAQNTLLSSLVFVAEGRSLICGYNNGSLLEWDGQNLAEQGAWPGHEDFVARLVVRDQTLISCAWDGTLRSWSLVQAAEFRAVPGLHGMPWGVTLHPEHEVAYVACSDGTVAACALPTAEVLWRSSQRISCAAPVVTSDGQKLLVLRHDGVVLALDCRDGAILQQAELGPDKLGAMAKDPRDPLRYWVAREDGLVAIDASLQILAVIRSPERIDRPHSSVISPGGDTAIVHSSRGAFWFDLRQHSVRRLPNLLQSSFLTDGRVCTLSNTGELRLLTATGEIQRMVKPAGFDTTGSQLAVVDDDQRILVGCGDGYLRILDMASGAKLLELPGHDYPICGMAVSLDRGWIVTSAGTFIYPGELHIRRVPR